MRLRSSPSCSSTTLFAGENSIIIVGGANQDDRSWRLAPGAQQLLRSAGAVLLQREIPEKVNIAVAKVGAGCVIGGGRTHNARSCESS
jgi:hypothetical protein